MLGVKVEPFSSPLFMSWRESVCCAGLALNQVGEVGCQPLAHRAVLWVIVTSGASFSPRLWEGGVSGWEDG